ncbi:hypothetical protein N825_15715 [Skermanella stibiiresistens SB22]|uniref:Uncharacterized protein n=1 Tax=Skermanella stibiiresistens SB22 TaxID=1385369 RepID=W9GZG1_9PROT|nr:hypothetical protein [Skermanella stibiiresistens]EWY37847.1 hypothetical protein N825_15715 [Skermanella stibiiresistens SB22]
MHDIYVAKPLARRQIDQAFPVVQTIAPDLDIERWREFAAAILAAPELESSAGRSVGSHLREGGRGIMTVQNSRGYIHGLFSHAVEDHLRHGRVLSVENFIVLDLFDLDGAADALLGAMDKVADDLGCAAIHTNLPDDYSSLPEYCDWLLGCFREAGHAVETLRLCKQMIDLTPTSPRDAANDG